MMGNGPRRQSKQTQLGLGAGQGSRACNGPTSTALTPTPMLPWHLGDVVVAV